MSTALTIQEKQALMAKLQELGGSLDVGGKENLKPGDIGQPPRLRISQQNKPIEISEDVVAPVGAIVNDVTNQVFESGIEIIPLSMLSETRVEFSEFGENPDAPVMCRSDDGLMPAAVSASRTMTEPKPGPCDACSSAQWPDESGSPSCTRQRNFLVYCVDDDSAAILTMQKTSVPAARNLTKLALMNGLKKTILVATSRKTGDKGQWHEYTASAGRKLELGEQINALELKEQMANLIITADVQPVAEEAPPITSAPPGKAPGDGGSLDFLDGTAETQTELPAF